MNHATNMAWMRSNSIFRHCKNVNSLNFRKSDKSTKKCKTEVDSKKPVCKKPEEVPCEKLARGEDCSRIPSRPEIPCPKTVIQDCYETAVATTKPSDTKVEKAKDAKASAEAKVPDKKGAGGKAGETDMVVAQQQHQQPDRYEEEQEDSYDPKVVIVGAGLAGLSAANRLATTGVTNITILEASARAGGRIQSVLFGDTVVDLGGVWEEPAETNNYMDNPVLHHADNFGMIRYKKNLKMAYGMLTECDGSPLPLGPSFLALVKMRRILAVADTLKTSSSYNDQGRSEQYIGLRMVQELRSLPDELKAAAARVFTALTMLTTDKNFTAMDSFGPYVTVAGSGVKIPLGCSGVMTPLLQNVSKYIKFGKEVSGISWGSLSNLNGRRALVRTADGSEYSADFVVYTAPMGVLKQTHEMLFCPTLPCPYVREIEAVQFDHANKMFLYYKTPIKCWRQDPIDWTLEEKDVKCLKGPLNGLREIKELSNSDRVISVKFVGKGALLAENVSEKSLVDEITMYMSKRSGEIVPLPDDVLRTKWTANKYYRGARALNSVSSKPIPSCGSPNPPVIFFAGDGTSQVNSGNVRGAFITGLREADKILSYLPGGKNEIRATDACLQLQAALAS